MSGKALIRRLLGPRLRALAPCFLTLEVSAVAMFVYVGLHLYGAIRVLGSGTMGICRAQWFIGVALLGQAAFRSRFFWLFVMVNARGGVGEHYGCGIFMDTRRDMEKDAFQASHINMYYSHA